MARRVLTKEGEKYFGVPIGQLITPDKEDDAKALHGGRPAPPNSVSGSNQKRAGISEKPEDTNVSGKTSNPEKSKAAASSQSEATQVGDRWKQKGFIKPTISGDIQVFAGKSIFSAPEGSGIFKSPKHPGRVYVITPDGETHVLTSKGELNLTPAERQSLTSQVKATFEEVVELNDPKESEESPSWIRLVSLMRQMEQAKEVGDESRVKSLLEEFNDIAKNYGPEDDAKEVQSRVAKATGTGKKRD